METFDEKITKIVTGVKTVAQELKECLSGEEEEKRRANALADQWMYDRGYIKRNDK